MRNISRFLARNWNLCNFGLFLPTFGCLGNCFNSLENSGSTFEFTKPIKPYWTCQKFLDFLQETEICAFWLIFEFGCHGNSLGSLENWAYLKSTTQKPDFSCKKVLDFLHRTEINCLGSLKNYNSVLRFTSPEIPTVHAKNFSISCRELMSAFFAQIWLPWQPPWLPWNFIYHIWIRRPRKLFNYVINSSIFCREHKSVQFGLFLPKFGCHGNSLGSLEILDSIFEFADLENLTIRAKKSSISCAELKSVQFWLIFVQIWLPWQLPWLPYKFW